MMSIVGVYSSCSVWIFLTFKYFIWTENKNASIYIFNDKLMENTTFDSVSLPLAFSIFLEILSDIP